MIGIQGLPADGCNVFYGNYVDNYNLGLRNRYYIYDGQAVLSTSTAYNTLPSGVNCVLNLPVPNPFEQMFLILAVVVGVIAIILSAYMVVIKPFIKMKKGV